LNTIGTRRGQLSITRCLRLARLQLKTDHHRQQDTCAGEDQHVDHIEGNEREDGQFDGNPVDVGAGEVDVGQEARHCRRSCDENALDGPASGEEEIEIGRQQSRRGDYRECETVVELERRREPVQRCGTDHELPEPDECRNLKDVGEGRREVLVEENRDDASAEEGVNAQEQEELRSKRFRLPQPPPVEPASCFFSKCPGFRMTDTNATERKMSASGKIACSPPKPQRAGERYPAYGR
jgi:hypothetical protein